MLNHGNALLTHSLSVIFFGFFIGLLLVFLIIKGSKKKPSAAEVSLKLAWQDWNFDRFYSKGTELLEKMGLQIQESHRDQENEADILAQNPAPFIGGPVIIHLHFNPSGGAASSVDVMNFASNLVGDRKGKGLYITNGDFAPEVAVLPELPPMDLIDGKKLKSLFAEHQVDFE